MNTAYFTNIVFYFLSDIDLSSYLKEMRTSSINEVFPKTLVQIHVGSTAQGLPAFLDMGTGMGWLLRPGSVVEPVCGHAQPFLHFTGKSASPAPLSVTDDKLLYSQAIVIACSLGAFFIK